MAALGRTGRARRARVVGPPPPPRRRRRPGRRVAVFRAQGRELRELARAGRRSLAQPLARAGRRSTRGRPSPAIGRPAPDGGTVWVVARRPRRSSRPASTAPDTGSSSSTPSAVDAAPGRGPRPGRRCTRSAVDLDAPARRRSARTRPQPLRARSHLPRAGRPPRPRSSARPSGRSALAVEHADGPGAVRPADRHVPGRPPPAGLGPHRLHRDRQRHPQGARASTTPRPSATTRSSRRSPGATDGGPASGRSRCSVASASPPSTSTTTTTAGCSCSTRCSGSSAELTHASAPRLRG